VRETTSQKKKEVIKMSEYKDAGSKGVYIDGLRTKYPFRIVRDFEPEYQGVLCDVQPLSGGGEVPVYRFPGGACCVDPKSSGITILEW
jgi:hypothetical protein